MADFTTEVKTITALGLVSVALFGCQPEAPWGPGSSSIEAIVNGTREPQVVELTEPQIMAIGWLYVMGAPSRPFCTGTLIAPNLVITAAHCVFGGDMGLIGFGVGMDPNDPDALFPSTGAYPHGGVDAALLLLEGDATDGDVEIEPLRVNDRALDDSAVGRPVQAGGYGATYDPGRDGRWFATVYIAEVNPEEIVVDGLGEQGICFGDSGSGLIDLDEAGDPVVLAVESWGDESCVDIDHMTRLDAIYDWIGPVLEGEIPLDPCLDVPSEGRCVEEVAEQCPRGSLQQINCASLGAECLYIEEAERYGCVCEGIDEVGWCDGDIVERCRSGRIFQFNCGLRGSTCGYDEASGWYTCVEHASCRLEDELGRCDGETAVRCSDGRTTRSLCSLDEMICVETDVGAECVEPDSGGDGGVDDSGCSCNATNSRCGDSSLGIASALLLSFLR